MTEKFSWHGTLDFGFISEHPERKEAAKDYRIIVQKINTFLEDEGIDASVEWASLGQKPESD